MDRRYGGTYNRRKYKLNDVYNQADDINVFGNLNIEYSALMLSKHLQHLASQKLPAIVLYNEQYGSHEEDVMRNAILRTEQLCNEILFIDKNNPYYHPLYEVDALEKVIDPENELIKDEIAYLSAVIDILEGEHVPVKLHSLMTYLNYDIQVLIHKAKMLAGTNPKYNSCVTVFEQEAITQLSAMEPLRLLKKMKTILSDIENPNCQYSVTSAIKHHRIICINICGAQEIVNMIGHELSYINDVHKIILFNSKTKEYTDFQNEILNKRLSVYSTNVKEDLTTDQLETILGKQNLTLLFQMASGNAEDIVDYYGKYDYYYETGNHGTSHTWSDFLHLHDGKHTGKIEHVDHINKLSGDHVSSLLDTFECFEVDHKNIIYHSNVSFDGLAI